MIGRVLAVLGRVSPEPLLVRVGIYLAAAAGLLIAAPQPLLTTWPAVAALVVLAVAPALAPGGPWATLVALVAVTAWVAGTIWYDEPVALGRVLVLSGALYLLHSLSALGAALPYDAVVAPGAVVRWLSGALLVVAVASLVSVAVVAGLARFAGGGVHLAATIAGLVVATGIAILLSWLPRRR